MAPSDRTDAPDLTGPAPPPVTDPAAPPAPPRRAAPRFAARQLRRHPAALAVLALTLIGGVGLDLLAPLLIRWYIEQEVTRSTAAIASASLLVAGYLVVSLLARLVGVAEAAVAERLAWTVMDQVRVDVTRHCLALGMDFHSTTRPGDLVERVEGDVSLLANFLSRFVLTVVGQSLLLAGLIAALLVVDWRIGLCVGVLAVVATVALRRLARRGQASFDDLRQASSDLSGLLGEALSATPDISGSGGGPYVRRRLLQANRAVFRTEQGAALWGMIALWSAASFTAWLGTAVALSWSAWLYSIGAMTLGTVYLVFVYTQQMMQPLDQMALQIQDYQAAAACVGRLQGLLDLPAPGPGAGGRPFPSGPVRVEFRRTSFRYAPERPDVLRNIDVVVPAGETVGVVGRTGSGKSTLVRLLTGLYAPTGGAVLVNGVDITAVRPGSARERLAVISQEVQLFKATLRDNVTVFDPDRSDEQVRRAFDTLGMTEWLARLPDGLETVLGPGGHGLSAGEEQLVSFIRVVLADPSVVVLDEASSRLDAATEQLFKHAMTILLAGRTGLVVAHRLSTLSAVDRILYLEDGRMVEYGRREDLAGDPRSRFSRLLAQGVNDLDTDEVGDRRC
ncbi:ABC transporter ATP-binding protein [Micromonospora echinofusca]|uniref:ABC transporter ATP-binding protein n=1 Tax=Micromonospora echinofusca TaxID=47858 RepID=UPI00331D6B73